MLSLVIDNTKNTKATESITCRNSCDLFDENTESCSINQNVDMDSSNEVARCGFFLSKESMKTSNKNHMNFKFSLIEEEANYLLDDPEVFYQFVGKNVFKEEYTYPKEPDFSSLREDAKWFISPCGTYGCWIISLCNKPMSFPASREKAVVGWSKKVYKSPIPLHDHKTSISLASKMCWVIDEEGYGQYALLTNGTISSLASPKPIDWVK